MASLQNSVCDVYPSCGFSSMIILISSSKALGIDTV